MLHLLHNVKFQEIDLTAVFYLTRWQESAIWRPLVTRKAPVARMWRL